MTQENLEISKPFDNLDSSILHFFVCFQPPTLFKTPQFAGKMTLKDLCQRFLEILENDDLINAALSGIKTDLSSFRTFPLSPFEKYNLVRISNIFEIRDISQIIQKFPLLFNSAHHPSHFSAFFYRLTSRSSSASKQPNEFLDHFVQQIDTLCKDKELLSFRGDAHDLDNYNLLVDPHEAEKNSEFGSFDRINAFYECGKLKISPKAIAFLYSSQKIFSIDNCKVSIGRKTPLTFPTIDLSSFNSKTISRIHFEIVLATDFRFYGYCRGKFALVNGTVIHKDGVVLLQHGDLLDFGGICFIFFENKEVLHE